MPFTLTPLGPVLAIGPGLSFNWATDFIGPVGSPSHLDVDIFSDSEASQLVVGQIEPTFDGRNGAVQVLMNPDRVSAWGTHTLPIEGQAWVRLRLRDEFGVQDESTIQVPWDGQAGLGVQIPWIGRQQGGGLTESEALQLQQTQEATWPEHLVDQLTLVNLGTGSSSLPINANLTSPVFAVIVRLTAVPSDLLPQTPDGDYWVPTLATVRIYRGSDLWIRAPIHTSSKIVNLWVEGLALGLADAVLSAGWLLNLTLQTTFLPGVQGQVFLMRVP